MPRRAKGYWYPPGILYDLAFKIMLRRVRRKVARIVERKGLYPWLDVCSGTGDQLRTAHTAQSAGRARRRGRRDAPQARIAHSDPASSHRSVPDPEYDAVGRGMRARNLAIGLDMHLGFVRYAAARAPGVPFVCGDAARLPFRDESVRAISISFGLHDKNPEQRKAIVQEARRALDPDGKLIAVDFERPWNAESRIGALFSWAIERSAPREHYRNGREFLRSGGLRGFLRAGGFLEVERRDVKTGSLAIVVARPAAR
ncbi:MAG: methyltransferase domain-containing protein [Candidatus Aminicenantes bacterium]|nr:methyltransferase domain-containing protein [Candidatus Aminicenantes bacterium]